MIIASARLLLGERGLVSRALRWVSYALGMMVVLLACGLMYLQSNAALRNRVFAAMCAGLAREPAMIPLRCERLGLATALGNLSVIEFGAGPGTNFQCFGTDRTHHPRSWVGVEPNQYFAEAQARFANEYNLTFPRRTVWLRGEVIDVAEASFDAAIFTHVLCSVDDAPTVLRQAARALKPGGRLFVMEHVSAPEGSLARLAQRAFAPGLEIVGNGCKFIDAATILRQAEGFEDLLIESLLAPMPIPLFRPHIIATATRSNAKL